MPVATTGWKAAVLCSRSSAFRTTPPARSWPLTSNSKPKIPSAISAPACLDRGPWHSAQPLPRSSLHLPAQRCPLDPRRTTRRKTISHPTGTRSRRTRHRADPRLLAPGQRPHRARLAHLSGPSGQRTSPRPGRHFGGGQRRTGELLRRLQPPLRSSRRPCRLGFSPPAAPLRPLPLPRPALSAPGQCRSHRRSGHTLHRAAAPARSPRLRRRNRRPFPSARRHPPHLSRRPFADGFAPAPARTRPTPPCGHPLGAETKTQDAPHLQPLRPPCSGSRYLIDRGDRISLQLIRQFLVATTRLGVERRASPPDGRARRPSLHLLCVEFWLDICPNFGVCAGVSAPSLPQSAGQG